MSINLPSLVEIEINSNCNLSCSYCPNSVGERIEQGEMKEETFNQIISQLKEYNYRGRVAFEFYNEPLLATKLEFFISTLKEELPHTTLYIYTNGVYLKSAQMLGHLKKIGVDKFIITKHEQVNSLPIDKFFDELSDEEKAIVDYKDHDDIIKFNRAGCVKEGLSNKNFINQKCSVPSSVLTISVDGNVISCFEDFYQKYQFENSTIQNVIKTWNSKQYRKFKSDLLQGKRSNYSTCTNCNRVDQNMKNKNKHLIDEDEIDAITNVIRSGELFRYGSSQSQCSLAEKEFSEYFDSSHSFLLSSGTNALVTALMACGISYGDEVIIPAYTFVATAGAVLSVGAIPVVVDIDDDLCISIDEINKKITDRTKAIIPVHMDGLQCKIDEITSIGKEHGIYIIEDVAQAMGASYKGKKLGTRGHIGCFSFNQDKTITAGEGGLVITSDEELATRLLSSIDQAISFNPSYKDELSSITPFLGLSTRVSEITGAMLRVQLKKIDKILSENKERKSILLSILKESEAYGEFFELITANDEHECSSSVHIKFNDPVTAATLSKKMLNMGISVLPVSMRRAHCVWKWSDLLRPGRSYSEKVDPYLNTDKTYNYNKVNYMNALNLLMSTLRMEVDITLTSDETRKQGDLLTKIIMETYEKL